MNLRINYLEKIDTGRVKTRCGDIFTCRKCGKTNNLQFYSALPLKFFNTLRGEIVCADCLERLEVINRFVEIEILKNCSDNLYPELNAYFLSEGYDNERDLTVHLKKEFFIIINPHKIYCTQKNKKTNGNGYKNGKREKGKIKQSCVKCGSPDNLTRHHPKRRKIFGNGENDNNNVIILCRDCHNSVESFIEDTEVKILKHYKKVFEMVYKIFLWENISFKRNINFYLIVKEEQNGFFSCEIKR